MVLTMLKKDNVFLNFPQIDPVIFNAGPIAFHWYGLMYIVGFIFAMQLAKYKLKYKNICSSKEIEDILYVSFLGLFIGGRLGYVLFYNLECFIQEPSYLFKVWNGGMSFHGGLLGVILSLFIYKNFNKISFLEMTDFIAPLVPFGLGIGRLGNFINGELFGRVTTVPWALLFPNTYDSDIQYLKKHPEWQTFFNNYGSLPRHPSQIYEFILEGIVLFLILNFCVKKSITRGYLSSIFLISYGMLRFFVEFFRQPDMQIGLFFDMISMGQILSIPMIMTGFLIIFLYQQKENIIK